MQTSQPITIDAFKQFAADIAPAARAVLMARVFAEMERERVNAYILPIFRSYTFTVADKWQERGRPAEVITDPERLYLSDDEPMVASYYEACDAAHRENGFKGPKGHCPALTAESLVRVAESHLIDLARPVFGVEAHMLTLEKRAKYLDLLIGAAIKADAEKAGR